MRALKRLDVWLNDISLRDVDSRICITEITEPDADVTLDWGTCPGVNGQRLLRRTRQVKRVRVEYDIRELFDIKARAAIVTAVNGWAGDGMLKVSHRPGQQMRVALSQAAAFNGARDVLGKYVVEFSAGPVPYWEDETPTEISITGSSGSGSIVVPGQADTWAKISVTPSGATLSTLSITIAGQTMAFSGLSVASGTALVIDHDARGLLTVTAGSASALDKRTAASVDDFAIAPGTRAVSYTANTACAVTVSVRGRYL